MYHLDEIHDLNSEKANNKGEYEYCVLCWKKTKVKRKTPVSKRPFYITGIGQLCHKCYHDNKEK